MLWLSAQKVRRSYRSQICAGDVELNFMQVPLGMNEFILYPTQLAGNVLLNIDRKMLGREDNNSIP